MHGKSSLTTTIQRNDVPIRVWLGLISGQQHTYAELEGNKNDVIDVLIAFGIAVLLFSIAIEILHN